MSDVLDEVFSEVEERKFYSPEETLRLIGRLVRKADSSEDADEAKACLGVAHDMAEQALRDLADENNEQVGVTKSLAEAAEGLVGDLPLSGPPLSETIRALAKKWGWSQEDENVTKSDSTTDDSNLSWPHDLADENAEVENWGPDPQW